MANINNKEYQIYLNDINDVNIKIKRIEELKVENLELERKLNEKKKNVDHLKEIYLKLLNKHSEKDIDTN